MRSRCIVAFTAAASFVAAASGQIAINEIWENPPNGGDNAGYEFIELYGPANYDLTGYMIALVKGAGDVEIDEAYTLDGWKIGANGFLVLHGSTSGGTGDSPIRIFGHMDEFPPCGFPPVQPCFSMFEVASLTNRPFKNGVPFVLCDIAMRDVAGKFENDNSSTYLLIRKRPQHTLNATPVITPGLGGPVDHFGFSRYATNYCWAKDFAHDLNADSRLDFGDEHNNSRPFQPLQIVDEVSWSNGGGFEYNTPGLGLMSGKISETPGFNPDSGARVRYMGSNPLIGWTVTDDQAVRTTLADESWIYGENLNVSGGDNTNYGKFKYYYENASGMQSTTNRDQRTFGAPTNPNGRLYTFNAAGSPFVAPYFEQTSSYDPINGTQLFEPYGIEGYRVSPGGFNDAPANSVLIDTAIEHQFRWVRGDFNFDGVVTCDDLAMIRLAAEQSWTLDDVETKGRVDANGDPIIDSGTGQQKTFQHYMRQLQTFNGTLAMIRMSLADNSTGEWTSGQILDGSGNIIAWGGAVTQQDVAQFESEFPTIVVECSPVPTTGACCTNTGCLVATEADCIAGSGAFKGPESVCDQPSNPVLCCKANFNAINGVTVQDIFDFLTAWLAGSTTANFNGVNGVTVQDIFDFLTAWLAGC